jgi:histidine triad (HIT) family protein
MAYDDTCPFCSILRGEAPGTIIARDDEKGFALIRSIHPESIVHWLAIPTNHVDSTEVMEQKEGGRLLELLEFAIREVRSRVETVPQFNRGFTVKMHFGSYESIPHAKLHVLAAE